MIIANLKTNFNKDDIIEYEKGIRNLDIVICPPDIYLTLIKKGKYSLGSQNVSIYENGPYTGEVSASQLKSIGVKYSLVGHSERRKLFKEDYNFCVKKIYNLVNNGIIPVYCIGEDANQKDQVDKFLIKNIDEVFKSLHLKYREKIIIAYEPSWSISDGISDKKIPETQYISNVVEIIKSHIKTKYRLDAKVLYGGSVNKSNIGELHKIMTLDGFLIGKSSKNVVDLKEICKIVK